MTDGQRTTGPDPLVYTALNARLVLETRETEITSLFAHAAALLLLLGVGLSMWWYGRVI